VKFSGIPEWPLFHTCPSIMKTLNHGAVAALGIACLVSCAAPAKTITVYMSSSTRDETSLSNQVFREVNSYRRDRNKKDLISHPGLARLAREHAQFLRLNRGKYGAGVSDANHIGFANRAMKAQYTMGFGRVAENVVCCHGGGGATFVRLWSHSPPHNATMIGAYQYTGIGTVVDKDGMVFSVQLFAVAKSPVIEPAGHFGEFW
jgi:uncharacterized protein YkwD